MRSLWPKLAALAVAGSTAFAMFGGGTVHTMFQASQTGDITAGGATVGLGLSGGTDTKGNIVCTNLVPGGPACTTTISLTNNGSANAVMSLVIGTPVAAKLVGPTAGALAGEASLSLSDTNYAYGPASVSAFVGNTYGFSTEATGYTDTITVSISLPATGNVNNDWAGDGLTVPYTAYATEGA